MSLFAKKRVLILTNCVMSYRIPIFTLLGEIYELTVAYSHGNILSEQYNFKTIFLDAWQYKRIVIQKDSVYKLASGFDVVIYTGDIAWIKYSMLGFKKNRSFKLICWTIGVSASYSKEYDSVKRWDIVRDFFYKRSDALLFYSDYPVRKYIGRGFSSRKLFVANNTVSVVNSNCQIEKKYILFIGTLYRAKGVLELIEAYYHAYLKCSDIPDLNIVGKGDDYTLIDEWIKTQGLSSKVHLLGAIYDENEKEKLFKSAYACISPNQAGLSVLESMAHGTPYITRKNAITGGERFNIQPFVTGLLYDDQDELVNILIDIKKYPQKYLDMGYAAKKYYDNSRTPELMVEAFINAIDFVLQESRC